MTSLWVVNTRWVGRVDMVHVHSKPTTTTCRSTTRILVGIIALSFGKTKNDGSI
jgi:hypothetical protein